MNLSGEVCFNEDTSACNPDDPAFDCSQNRPGTTSESENVVFPKAESEDIESKNANESSLFLDKELQKKEENSHRKNGFVCLICSHVASSSKRLEEHLSKHTGKKTLKCSICLKEFAWRNSYRNHMFLAEVTAVNNEFLAEMIYTWDQLQTPACHDSTRKNVCNICDKKYCSKSALKKHILRVHERPESGLKTCDKCGKSFLTNSELTRHSFAHVSERPCVCEQCGKTYRYKSALVVHFKTHTGERPFRCGFCSASFLYQSSVIGHRRLHTKEKPYQCTICEKTFRVKRLLTSHMRVHSNTKQFSCKNCPRSYQSRSGYHAHVDFHLGLKRHICKYCGKAFRARSNMDKHVRRHARSNFDEDRMDSFYG